MKFRNPFRRKVGTYTFKYPATFKANSGTPDFMRESIVEVIRQHHEHLEKYAAAFLLQVGSAEASKYQLIEQRRGMETRWFYKLLEETE
tara:strand:- start:184 stop:450 length:267 start_codon:yes stop_codon:yes gene_type:complete